MKKLISILIFLICFLSIFSITHALSLKNIYNLDIISDFFNNIFRVLGLTSTSTTIENCDSQCKAQGYSSGTCRTNNTNINLADIPDDWGGYETYGDVVYMPSSCYPNCPQITHVDYSVLHNGHVSIRIDHHVNGADPNGAREVNGDWLAVKPGNHIVFKCWIKTSPATGGKAPDLGYPWGSGGRLGIDFYDTQRISAIESNPNGIVPNMYGGNWETSEAVRANYVLWGNDWTMRVIDMIVPQKIGADGSPYPNGELHTPTGIIPWLQAWGNEPETGVAWFSDCELYINPTDSGESCKTGETSVGQDSCLSGQTCCCFSPTTIIVPDNYPDIQSAINAVPNGTAGDIFVRAGKYTLNPVFKWPPNQIVLKSKITLRGEGIDKTIIEMAPSTELAAQMREDVITTTGDVSDVTLQDFTVIQRGVPDNNGSSCVYFRTGTHSNVRISRIKVTDAFGGCIGVHRVTNLTIEDCVVERCWTGIGFTGSNGVIRRNRVLNMVGDGIFPQGLFGLSVTDFVIEDNYAENIGDTGIDITSTADVPAHARIIARNNTLKNAHIRISYASDIELSGNNIENGQIDVDNGAGAVVNVTVKQNSIRTDRDYGIGFYGAQDCSALNNNIDFYGLKAGFTKQVGISAGIWDTARIEGNRITNAANYGIDFGEWRMGGATAFTIKANTITDFGKYGIYDNAKEQSKVFVVGNTITSDKSSAIWGVLTDFSGNPWRIENNRLQVNALVGNAAINAAGSTLTGNGPPMTMETLRGVGYVAASWEARYSVAELQRLKSLGFSAIALQYFWDQFERQDGTYDMTSFSWIDTAVRNCEQTGMKIYLSHRTTWGTDPTGGVYDGSWFKAWDKAHNGIADVFDPNGSILSRLVKFTEFLVQRYDSSPAIVGYNIENYPYHRYDVTGGPSQKEIDNYYNYGVPQLTQAVRRHSAKTVFVSPLDKGEYSDYGANTHDTRWFATMPSPSAMGLDSNTVFLLDGWGPISLKGDEYMYPIAGWTKDIMRTIFADAVAYSKKYNAKLMVDEFGIPATSSWTDGDGNVHYGNGSQTESGLQYLDALIDVFYEFTDSWIYHMELIGISDGVPYVAAPKNLNLLSQRANYSNVALRKVDFETGDFSQVPPGDTHGDNGLHLPTIVANRVHSGTYAAECRINNASAGHSSDIRMWGIPPKNAPLYYSFWIYVEDGYEVLSGADTWNSFVEWCAPHPTSCGKHVDMAMMDNYGIKNNLYFNFFNVHLDWGIPGASSQYPNAIIWTNVSMPTGKWVFFETYYKTDMTNGIIQVKMDDKVIFEWKGRTEFDPGTTTDISWTLMNYCGLKTPPHSFWFDDIWIDYISHASKEDTITSGSLKGEYYDNIDLNNLKITRTDSTINFDWGSGSPDVSMDANTFSVRWQGYVKADYSETYTFYVTTDDGSRLWIDNKLVIDSWVDQSPTEHSGSIYLTAGWHSILYEFYENGGEAVAKLSYSSPSITKQIIPSNNLGTITESCDSQCKAQGYSSGSCKVGNSGDDASIGILHADGITIKNSLNQVVHLRGIHSDWNVVGDIYGGHPGGPYWSESDVQTIKAHGGNIIDISVITWSSLMHSSGVIDMEHLSAIDNTLAWCKKYQVNCIVEMSNVNFAYSSWVTPDWMKHGQTDGSKFELDFFDPDNHVYDDTRQAVIDFFVFLTNRYKDNDYFMLDPFNEPFNGNTAIYPGAGSTTSDQAGVNYARFIERVYDAVVNAGYRNILVVDHPYCPWDMVTPVNRSNIVWDVHAYDTPTGKNGSCLWGDCEMSGWIHVMTNYQTLYADTFHNPLWAGEYGIYDYYNNPDNPVSHDFPDWQNAINQEIDWLNNQSKYSGRIFLSYGNVEGEWYDTWAEMNGRDNFNTQESEWLLTTLLGAPSGSSTTSTCQSGETSVGQDSCPSGQNCCCYKTETTTTTTTTIATTSTISTTTIPKPDLILNHKFDEGSGTAAKDSSTYHNDGTLFNNPKWVDGKSGKAIQIKGANYTEVPDSNSLDISNGITLEAWVYPSSLNGWTNIIERDQQAGYKLGFYNNNAVFTLYGLWDAFATGTIPVNQWSHIAATYDMQNVKIYINGNLDTTIPYRDQIGVGTSPLDIGRRRGNNADYFNGTIDEVKVWNRALTTDEIKNEYGVGTTTTIITTTSTIMTSTTSTTTKPSTTTITTTSSTTTRLTTSTTMMTTSTITTIPGTKTVTYKISASYDDTASGIFEGSGWFGNPTTAYIYVGNKLPQYDKVSGYLRWTIDIPSGSTINSANIKLVAYYSDSLSSTLKLYLLNENDCAQYSDIPYTSRSTIGTNVIWLTNSWNAGTEYTSSDIKTLIQEFINMPGYTAGKHMCLKISNDTSIAYYNKHFYAYDGDPAKAAKLDVTYSTGVTPTTTTSTTSTTTKPTTTTTTTIPTTTILTTSTTTTSSTTRTTTSTTMMTTSTTTSTRSTTTTTTSTTIPTSDPIGYWKLDEGSGSTTKDSSNNGNDGTLYNMLLPNDMDSWTESALNWYIIAGSGSVSFNTADKQVGTGSVYGILNADSIGQAEIVYNPTGTWNLNGFSKIYVWIKYDVKTSTSYHDISLFDSTGKWRWWDITSSVVAGSWKKYEIDLKSGYGENAGFNLASVDGIAIKTKNLGSGASQKVWADGLYFNKWIDGKSGKALSFNGIDNYVNVPHSSSLDLSSAVTVAAWIRPNSLSTLQIPVAKGIDKNWGYEIWIQPSGGLIGFGIGLSPGNGIPATAPVNNYLAVGKWSYIVGTADASTGKIYLYIDGQKVGETSFSGSINQNTYPFQIGKRYDGLPFNGTIDEVKVWNKALTADEIRTEYTGSTSLDILVQVFDRLITTIRNFLLIKW